MKTDNRLEYKTMDLLKDMVNAARNGTKEDYKQAKNELKVFLQANPKAHEFYSKVVAWSSATASSKEEK